MGSRAKGEQSYGSFARFPIIFGSAGERPLWLAGVQCPQNFHRIGPDGHGNVQEFDDIDAALAAFVFGEEGLRFF